MKNAVYKTADKRELLEKVFPCIVERGLENVTIRELCRETGFVQGTLYYWFKDKESIVYEAAKWGLKDVVDKLFRYVSENIGDLYGLFSNCLDEVDKYKKEIRFIYQMAASPVYGDKIRKTIKVFNIICDKYSIRLSTILNCDMEELRQIVCLFISAVCNYIIWDDKETSQMQLEYIYDMLSQMMKPQLYQQNAL